MTKPTHNLGVKVFACFLLILSGISAVLSGGASLYAENHGFFSGSALPYHKTILCQNVTYDYSSGLIDHLNTGAWNEYDREAFASENTNYRYSIIMENGEILMDNLNETENVVLVNEFHSTLYPHYVQENVEMILDAVGDADMANVIVEGYIVEPPTVADDYWNSFQFHQKLYDIYNILLPILLGSILIFAASFIFLLCAAGHQAGKEEIVPNLQDKIPSDLYLVLSCGICCGIGILVLDGNPFSYPEAIIVGCAGIFIIAILVLASILTCATRIKMGRYFYQNTILYRLLCLLQKILFVFFDALKTIPSTRRIAIVWLLVSSVYIGGGFGAMILNLVLLFVFCTIAAQMQKLEKGGKELANGHLDHKIDTKQMFPRFRQHGEHLNSLSKGFSIALDQKMKSERLKTELITNVSHDIKTPLTSIINYVDLLKKENLEGQAAEYIDVLDRQSKRLQKLTEDLVEASKASTGNLKVNLVPTDMGELAAQAVAEYEEKLEKSALEVVTSVSESPVYAMVDGNLTWRVLSNLLSNACKYSQTGTRVYIDIKNDTDLVTLSMKNISKDALNIPAEELMERFVRGDSSRHTEGSGLGLNIAQSLVHLQKGKFTLDIDGDLFKASIQFPAAKPPAPPAEEEIETTEV